MPTYLSQYPFRSLSSYLYSHLLLPSPLLPPALRIYTTPNLRSISTNSPNTSIHPPRSSTFSISSNNSPILSSISSRSLLISSRSLLISPRSSLSLLSRSSPPPLIPRHLPLILPYPTIRLLFYRLLYPKLHPYHKLPHILYPHQTLPLTS